MPRVAISFSSMDRPVVDDIEHQLNQLGVLLTRYETHLRPQDRIDLYIKSLLNFDAVLVVLSQSYMESDICIAELITLAQRPDASCALVR